MKRKLGEPEAEGFTPTAVFRALWAGFPPLQAGLIFAGENGAATPAFRGAWRQRFGTTLSHVERLVTPEGDETDYFRRMLP